MSAPPSIGTLAGYVERGLIRRRDHRGLAIFNYTEQCTFGREWDDVTTQARGLIYDVVTGDIVARPWPKFFNHNEPEATVPEGLPDEVTVKYDGCLGIGYLDGRGDPRWSTRGDMASPQSGLAQLLWERDHKGKRWPEGVTPLVEVVHPLCKVIVEYEWDGLVLLGARTLDGGDLPRAEVLALGDSLGMRVAAAESDIGAHLASVVAGMDHTAEGYVARWGTGAGSHRVKFKSAAYLDLARLMAGISERFVADCWVAGVDLPPHVPEETQVWFDAQVLALDVAEAAMRCEVGAIHDALTSAHGDDRKGYAIAAKSAAGSRMGLLMRLFSGGDVDWRERVYIERFGSRPRPVSLG